MRCGVTLFLPWKYVAGERMRVCQMNPFQGSQDEHEKGVQMAKVFQLRWHYHLYQTMTWERCISTDIAYKCWKVWTACWERVTNNLWWPCCYLDCSSASAGPVMNKMGFSKPCAPLASEKFTEGCLADKLIYSPTSFPGC